VWRSRIEIWEDLEIVLFLVGWDELNKTYESKMFLKNNFKNLHVQKTKNICTAFSLSHSKRGHYKVLLPLSVFIITIIILLVDQQLSKTRSTQQNFKQFPTVSLSKWGHVSVASSADTQKMTFLFLNKVEMRHSSLMHVCVCSCRPLHGNKNIWRTSHV
jgi:hypothetical protein